MTKHPSIKTLLLSVALAISTWSALPKHTAFASEKPINKSTQTLASQSGTVVPVRRILPQLKGKTRVPILLPNRLPLPGRFYFNSYAEQNAYTVGIGFTPNCNATACSLGEISAERGGQPSTPDLVEGTTNAVFKNVRLARGTRGVFTNGCGAYCTASVEWQYRGVLYRVSIKNGEERMVIQIANSAIEAGPR